MKLLTVGTCPFLFKTKMTMKENKKNVGSIWLSRKILNWQHFGEPNYLKVFLTLLLVANHKQRWWKGIKIERGETVITQSSLCKITGLSQATVCKIIKGLVKSGEITRKRTKFYHCITRIVKYSDYQYSYKGLFIKTKQLPIQEQETYSIIERNNNNIELDSRKILSDMLTSGVVIEGFCMTEGITVKQFEQLAKEVINDWELTKEHHNSENDLRRHLLNTVRLKIREKKLVGDSLDNRVAKLIEDCKRLIADGYPADKVREFYSYWTQPCTDGSGRVLFESVSAWDTEVRFMKYFKNVK